MEKKRTGVSRRVSCSGGVDVVLDALHDHLQRHQILPAFQNDDVREFPAWLHILLVHGLDGGEILGDYGLEGAPPLLHVPQGSAENADVGICFHENLDVEHISERGILKDQDPLHNNDLGGEDLPCFGGAVMLHIGVDGTLDGAARFQFLQVFDQQIRIECSGVVVIDFGTLLQRFAVLTLIVAVMADDRDLRAEMLLQMPGEGGFAGTGAAGDPNENGAYAEGLQTFVFLGKTGKNPSFRMKYSSLFSLSL